MYAEMIKGNPETDGARMITIDGAKLSDRDRIEKIIAEYNASEGITPIKKRTAWAVDQQLRGESQAYSWWLGTRIR